MKAHNGARIWRAATTIAFPAAAIALACTDNRPTPPKEQRAIRELPVVPAEHLARARAMREQTAWVGQAHHAAMQYAVSEARLRKMNKKGRLAYGGPQYCAIVRRVADAAMNVVERNQATGQSPSQRENILRMDPALAYCGGPDAPTPASIPRAFTAAAWTQSGADTVTGAYENYLDGLDGAVSQSDGTVGGIRQGLDIVVAQASANGVPTGDLYALSGFANLIESSANEWTNFDWSSTEPTGPSDSNDCAADKCGQYSYTSLFTPQGRGDKFWKVLGADVGGCLSSVKSWGALKALLFTPAWEALAGYCGVRAAVASGIALFFT